MKIFTIGFTKKSAQKFFTELKDAGVKRVVDVRLNNVSQLAGFAKQEDLRYFTKAICGIDYVHVPALAPTADILAAYKKHKGDWILYEQQFLDLMRSRELKTPFHRISWREAVCYAAKKSPTTATVVLLPNTSRTNGARRNRAPSLA